MGIGYYTYEQKYVRKGSCKCVTYILIFLTIQLLLTYSYIRSSHSQKMVLQLVSQVCICIEPKVNLAKLEGKIYQLDQLHFFYHCATKKLLTLPFTC